MANRPQPRNGNPGSGLGSLILGLIFGGVVGIIGAFWFAPRSGQETRQLIEGESIANTIEAGKAEARKLNRTHRP